MERLFKCLKIEDEVKVEDEVEFEHEWKDHEIVFDENEKERSKKKRKEPSSDEQPKKRTKQEKEKLPAIVRAAAMGRIDQVRKLLQDPCCDINATDSTGKTALMFAIINCKPAIVELLLNQFHLNFEVKSNIGKTAHYYASFYARNVCNMNPQEAYTKSVIVAMVNGFVANGCKPYRLGLILDE